jgi:hypothetical protein
MPLKLSQVLNHRPYADVLYKFTKTNFSNENFEFLYAVRQLNSAKGTALYHVIPSDKTTVQQKAQYIYERFIAPPQSMTSRRVQVNINSHTKQQLDQTAKSGNWATTSFDTAYTEIFNMMVLDTWRKFAKSKEVNDSNALRGYVGQFTDENGMKI